MSKRFLWIFVLILLIVSVNSLSNFSNESISENKIKIEWINVSVEEKIIAEENLSNESLDESIIENVKEIIEGEIREVNDLELVKGGDENVEISEIENDTKIIGGEEIVGNETGVEKNKIEDVEIREVEENEIEEIKENFSLEKKEDESIIEEVADIKDVIIDEKVKDETKENIEIGVKEIEIRKEEIIQGTAEIDKPVKWIKKIRIDKDVDNLTVEIPKIVSDIKVSKIVNNVKEEISLDRIELNNMKIQENGEFEIIIKDDVKEVEIEYYTEAPKKIEREINKNKKEVVISSDVRYENILAYSDIVESSKGRIKLYRITDGVKEKAEITNYVDSNSDGLIDRIEWIVPHLSN